MARASAFWTLHDLLARAAAVANRLPVGERTVRIGHDALYAESLDRWLASLAWKFGWLEAPERAAMARALGPGMVAVDVGANVGLHTIGLARAVGASGRVHALEPDPRNFRLLARAARGFPQVRLHEVAAAARSGGALLHLSAANSGDHRMAPAAEARRTVPVRAVALDDLLAREERVDLVKIDVQGAEADVLAGLRETLRRNARIVLLCELCPELLRRAGRSALEVLAFAREERLLLHRVRSNGLERSSPEKALAEAESRGYANLWLARSP